MACCDTCGEVFTLKYNLNVHIKNKHSEEGKGPLKKCSECEYMAVQVNLNQHNNNVHKKNEVKCSLCDEFFLFLR